MTKDIKSQMNSLEKLRDIMRHLRHPETGCPWDLKQTYETIIPHTIEEAYEVFEAIDNKDWPSLKDELGDFLLQIAFYIQFAEEDKHFTFEDVLQNINEKMIRRHPHVFGTDTADTPEAVLETWHKIKQQEKADKQKSLEVKTEAQAPSSGLSDLPKGLPALISANKVIKKAISVGFDWPEDQGVFNKITEELVEVKEAISIQDQDNLELEIGDLLFSVSVLATRHNINPERALQKMIQQKFIKRFDHMYKKAHDAGKTLSECSLEELDQWWKNAKNDIA